MRVTTLTLMVTTLTPYPSGRLCGFFCALIRVCTQRMGTMCPFCTHVTLYKSTMYPCTQFLRINIYIDIYTRRVCGVYVARYTSRMDIQPCRCMYGYGYKGTFLYIYLYLYINIYIKQGVVCCIALYPNLYPRWWPWVQDLQTHYLSMIYDVPNTLSTINGWRIADAAFLQYISHAASSC